MARLEVILRTGGDDLRRGSWANLEVKLVGQGRLVRFDKFTGVIGLRNGSVFKSL